MLTNDQQEINRQKSMLNVNCAVDLSDVCLLNNGILAFTDDLMRDCLLSKPESIPTHFIPASGSGSRMFQLLYKFVDDHEVTSDVTKFFDSLSSMAIGEGGESFSTLDEQLQLAQLILKKNGTIPKGLIPFHKYDNRITNKIN